MAGDPAAGVGGNAHPASGSKSSRSSTRHRQFRDRAKVRVDDLQEMFCGLQSARKESRSADAAVLEEQVHQMLREWRAELSVPSPASSLQNSQGNNREASDPPSDTLRLLQLAVPEEEDDASSKLLVPPSRQTHEHGQDSRMANTDQQCEAIDGGTAPAQHSLGQGVDGDCGEVSSVANAMFNHRMYYTDYELNIDDFLCGDGYKINISGSNEDQFNNLHGIGQLGHQQFDLPLDLPPTHSYADANNSEQNTGDVFVHMSDLLTTIWPSPSQYLGPKCALWDCGRPAGGTEDSGDYCNPYHAGLALNDDGLLGIRPVMRPRELFDLSLLEGESLREWLFFDTPRRAFESGNRKQRSLPDYGGRGWHESRKLVMKDFAGLKRSYYMDPQPSSSHEWHLFEYEINASDALALYRLEYKSSDPKKGAAKSKLASPLNEIRQRMGRLTADSPVENKRTARSKPKANQNQKDTNANTRPHVNTPNQVNAPNAYQTTQQVNQMAFLNGNVVYGPHLPHSESVVYGPHLPHSENVVYGPHLPHSENVVYGPHLPQGYSAEGSSFFWNPSDGT
uniref:Transcription factor VOZ1 n=1 Tax=Zea mays TaxID=4577 RepID=A0A804Q1Z9_MAIZE